MSNFYDSSEGLHTIAYQKAPNLCTEMEKVFDDVFAYKKSLSDAPKNERVKMVINYFKNTAGKKLLAVIKEYTGLNLELYVFKQFWCNFAVAWNFEKDVWHSDWTGIQAILNRYCGNLSNQEYQKYAARYKSVKTQEELEKISREVMHDKGAVTKAMTEKHDLHGILFFCPYTAFLAEDVYKKNIEPLTSKELAAIIAHECGHVISFLVHMIDICFKKDILYTAGKNYFVAAPPEVKRRIAYNTVKKYFPKEVKKVMDKLEEFKSHATPEKYKLVYEAVYAIWLLIFRIIEGVFEVAIHGIAEILTVTLIGPIEHLLSYNSDKASDFAGNTRIGGYYMEELADEYVSKMGYSGPLVHGLDKIFKWIRYTGGYTDAKGVSIYVRLLPWMASTLFKGYNEDFIHPDLFAREENAIMDTIKAFKNSNCPPEVLDEYYKMYKDIKKLSETSNVERKWMLANKAIQRAFEYLIHTPSAMLYTGRFHQEYETLFSQTKKLMDNQLYALSYGLSQPAEKK